MLHLIFNGTSYIFEFRDGNVIRQWNRFAALSNFIILTTYFCCFLKNKNVLSYLAIYRSVDIFILKGSVEVYSILKTFFKNQENDYAEKKIHSVDDDGII